MVDKNRFERIAIVGLGLIGGSFGLALKKKGFEGEIVGVDRQGNLEGAFFRKAIDKGFTREQMAEGLQNADLIFLCAPIHIIIEQLGEIGKYIKPGAVITDAGSIKRQIVQAAEQLLPSNCNFIGGHPMAGSEFKGVNAADFFLFENATWVLTPGKSVDVRKSKMLINMLEWIGAKVLVLDPQLHDEIAAAVSHLPQMAALSLMNLVAKQNVQKSDYFLKMAAGGFRDMTRIASSPYSVWEPICRSNIDMISIYIDAYIEELEKLKTLLAEKKLEDYFTFAAKNRLSIPTDTKGFIKPQFEISVNAEDKPGVIAKISSVLANNNINIKDMEVLKIREDEGGTFRLAFSTENDQQTAINLLKNQGFECRKRG